jgi:hypothetical protein
MIIVFIIEKEKQKRRKPKNVCECKEREREVGRQINRGFLTFFISPFSLFSVFSLFFFMLEVYLDFIRPLILN